MGRMVAGSEGERIQRRGNVVGNARVTGRIIITTRVSGDVPYAVSTILNTVFLFQCSFYFHVVSIYCCNNRECYLYAFSVLTAEYFIFYYASQHFHNFKCALGLERGSTQPPEDNWVAT